MFRELVAGVEWTPAFIGLLYYIAVIVTNRVSGADIAIVASLVFLTLRIDQLRVGKALIFLGLFTVWAWISFLIGGQDPDVYNGTWELTKVWMVAFVAFNAIRTKAQVRLFLAFAVFSFLIYPVRGALLNYVAGYTLMGRAIWNYAYANPNDLAAYALVFTSMSVALALLTRNKLIRLSGLVSAGTIVVLILLTQSRGAIIALGLVGLWTVVRRVRNAKVLLAALVIGLAGLWFAPDTLWTRLGGLANVSIESGMEGVDEERSAEQRWQLAKIAARIARDNLGVGVGVGAYPKAHAAYASEVTSELSLAGGNRDAHNTYLRTTAELGIVGLLLLVCELSVGVFAGSYVRRQHGRGGDSAESLVPMRSGLIAYILAGFFGSFAYIVMLHILVVLIERLALSEEGAAASVRWVQGRRQGALAALE